MGRNQPRRRKFDHQDPKLATYTKIYQKYKPQDYSENQVRQLKSNVSGTYIKHKIELTKKFMENNETMTPKNQEEEEK